MKSSPLNAAGELNVRVIPVAGTSAGMGATNGLRKIGFYNHTKRDLALTIDGKAVTLPAMSYLHAQLPPTFTWKCADKPAAKETVDVSGMHVLPGAIDVHVHFRDPGYPHKEDFASGTIAAAFGGVTTIFDMPNTIPTVGTPEALAAKHKMAAEGILRELKRRRHYIKPSVKRRKKMSEAARRRRKRLRTDDMPRGGGGYRAGGGGGGGGGGGSNSF